MANKITVTSLGTTANVNATPDSARYYSDKSKEWAIGEKLIDNEDYSSKYYANESKKQANIATAKTTEVIASGNTAVSNIESARDNAITDITNQENLSVDNVNTAGITQVANVNSAGTTQVNLAKEQVTLATNKANIATEQATIATSQASIATSKTTEVVESGNTAISNIETAKSNALNDINTAGAEYVNNAKQYAKNALNSATNAKTSEDNALSYKNSAQESSQTATEQASIAVTNANKAITSATNAKTSETNAKSSETRCEEILSRLGTTIKIKGRVDSLSDLPSSGNLDGDAYLVGEEGLDSYPEYYWYQDHWEFLGTSGTSLSWGLISGNIAAQTDLQAALDSKQDKGNYALKSEIPTKTSQLTNDSGFINNDSTFVHKSGNETIAGTKTFSSTILGSINGKSTQLYTPRVNTDYNSLPIKNTTYIEEHQDSSSNKPEAKWFFAQTMQGGDVNYAGQLAMGMTTKNVYYRNKSANKWSAWEKLAFTTDNVSSSTKATQDGNGNNIVNTYATKTSLNAKANTSLSNITDAGKKVIKDNSGSWNPPLLSSFWADHLLNRMDMLRADTFSWQSGTTYLSVYNELLSEYNNSASTTKTDGSITYKRTPKGYKIALANQETAILNKYNSEGIAWYYILDTANKRFKLPRTKFGFEGLRTSVGDDIKAGLPNITGRIEGQGDRTSFQSASGAFYKSGVISGSGAAQKPDDSCQIAVEFNASRSNSIYGNSDTVQPPATQMYLYFYVGNFTESAEAQTAGLKAELLNMKADVSTPSIQAPYIKDTYVNGTSGYSIWSDGYCEQWGKINCPANSQANGTLLKTYKDTNYNFIAIDNTSPLNGAVYGFQQGCGILTNNTFFVRTAYDSTVVYSWKTCGYLAEGEY